MSDDLTTDTLRVSNILLKAERDKLRAELEKRNNPNAYPQYRMQEITNEVERLRAELAIAHPLNKQLYDGNKQLRADNADITRQRDALLALLKVAREYVQEAAERSLYSCHQLKDIDDLIDACEDKAMRPSTSWDAILRIEAERDKLRDQLASERNNSHSLCEERERLRADKVELLMWLKKIAIEPCNVDDYEQAESIIAKHEPK